MKPPRERKRYPYDLRDTYYATLALQPVFEPFPPTGSFYYRHGVFDGRYLTAKEQQFEVFVSKEQALEDEYREREEWRRLRNLEEAAAGLCYELGENMEEFSKQMKTRDQMEMEFQCQRKSQKALDLNPEVSREKQFQRYAEWSFQRYAEWLAGESTRDAERIKSRAREEFKARVQQASQQYNVGQSKPEEHGDAGQPVSSTGVDSARQREPKPKVTADELRRELRDQGVLLSENRDSTDQPVSSTGAYLSMQQERETELNTKEKCRQFRDQIRSLPAITNVTMTQTRTTTNVRPAAAEASVFAGNTCVNQLQTVVPEARQGSFGAEFAAYRGKGLGLLNLDLGCSSKAEQGPNGNIGQWPDTLQDHPVTAFSEQQSTSPSSQQTSSKESTPPSSTDLSPPKAPVTCSHNPHGMRAKNPTCDDQNENIDNISSLLELERANYLDGRPGRWEKLRPSLRHNELLNSVIRGHLEYQRLKAARILVEETAPFLEECPTYMCSRAETSQQESKPNVE